MLAHWVLIRTLSQWAMGEDPSRTSFRQVYLTFPGSNSTSINIDAGTGRGTPAQTPSQQANSRVLTSSSLPTPPGGNRARFRFLVRVVVQCYYLAGGMGDCEKLYQVRPFYFVKRTNETSDTEKGGNKKDGEGLRGDEPFFKKQHFAKLDISTRKQN